MTTAQKRVLGPSKTTFPRYVQQYLESKAMEAEIAARVKKQRDQIVDYLVKNGIEDEKGNVRIDVGELGIAKRERRVSNVFDSEFAEAYLKKHKLWVDCTETITVIDEDKVLARIYDGTIPEEVGDEMYTEKESFALKIEAAK